MKYLIVLFKNKERKKIINKFKTYERAKNFFDKKINEDVIFDKRVENGRDCYFELGLLEKNSENFDSVFVKDDMGRQIKVELDDSDYKIIKISTYKVEDLIFDVSKNKRISFNNFYRTYLPRNGVKLVSKINNKIIVQEDDNINLFSLKCDKESDRFFTILNEQLMLRGRTDCILVPDSSKAQKKYLYELLESKGISKSILYRRSTTFFRG
jgi:hypothetical protein